MMIIRSVKKEEDAENLQKIMPNTSKLKEEEGKQDGMI
jgi:hypothetical protein